MSRQIHLREKLQYRKETVMNRILYSLLSVFLLLIISSHQSYAEPGAPMDNVARCCNDERMPLMPPMLSHGMERREGMPEAEHPLWRHLMSLGLDEKQGETMKEIKSRVAIALIKKRADEHVAGIELKDLLEKDPVDLKVVETKLQQIEAIKTETHFLFIKAMEEVKSRLTPEQRKKLKEMQERVPNMDPPKVGGMTRGEMRMAPLGEKK